MSAVSAATTLVVTMPDGSRWGVPLLTLARVHAHAHQHLYAGEIHRSLHEGTNPLLESRPRELIAWAQKNIAWQSIRDSAHQVATPGPTDYQAGWSTGATELV